MHILPKVSKQDRLCVYFITEHGSLYYFEQGTEILPDFVIRVRTMDNRMELGLINELSCEILESLFKKVSKIGKSLDDYLYNKLQDIQEFKDNYLLYPMIFCHQLTVGLRLVFISKEKPDVEKCFADPNEIRDVFLNFKDFKENYNFFPEEKCGDLYHIGNKIVRVFSQKDLDEMKRRNVVPGEWKNGEKLNFFEAVELIEKRKHISRRNNMRSEELIVSALKKEEEKYIAENYETEEKDSDDYSELNHKDDVQKIPEFNTNKVDFKIRPFKNSIK